MSFMQQVIADTVCEEKTSTTGMAVEPIWSFLHHYSLSEYKFKEVNNFARRDIQR